VLDHDGCEYYSHARKAEILHAFYHNLMGCVHDTAWNFSLDSIYPEGPLPLIHLSAPFTYDEFHNAIHRMHSNASPGPDGFGPSFFKATWSTTSQCVIDLCHAFYVHTAELKRINRSYLVLLPKKNDSREAKDFWLIALQNTTIKCVTSRPKA
jgi:hypothetical protein